MNTKTKQKQRIMIQNKKQEEDVIGFGRNFNESTSINKKNYICFQTVCLFSATIERFDTQWVEKYWYSKSQDLKSKNLDGSISIK